MLELKNISKKWGDQEVFNTLSATFNKGDMCAIKGESGSGKTTLLNIISLMEPINDGKIILDNKELTTITNKADFYRNTLGLVFQNFGLVEDETVEKNLKIALKFSKTKKKDYLSKMKTALADVSLSEEFITKKVFSLSGGEQQRVAIARLLLKETTLIVADEPTGSLDKKNSEHIFKLLKKLAEDNIVIIATHEDTMDNYFNKIIYL